MLMVIVMVVFVMFVPCKSVVNCDTSMKALFQPEAKHFWHLF